MTAEDIRNRMARLAAAQPLPALCEALAILDAKPKLDEAERLTRATLIDAICEKSPEADTAFDMWADSDDDPRSAVEVIIAAALRPAAQDAEMSRIQRNMDLLAGATEDPFA